MTILSKKFLQKEIKAKKLVISPYNPRNVGPGSIDLTLSNTIRKFKEIWRTFLA